MGLSRPAYLDREKQNSESREIAWTLQMFSCLERRERMTPVYDRRQRPRLINNNKEFLVEIRIQASTEDQPRTVQPPKSMHR